MILGIKIILDLSGKRSFDISISSSVVLDTCGEPGRVGLACAGNAPLPPEFPGDDQR